ncbi:hypothetical protein DUNSADRAFT_9467 [Dunaliella salina]|uniref:Uncharacterized protein n=1 Tax=Dunaliella salina TaxID=3046 RepID=A0ABQ7GHF1_DUNSA|nr:hypothetical protein DUNSADRAFT_9467 [Dunaliella salina]|eukprot:KAF5834028.1 hypothetical protein DUNSADRAFT_9467 [Dunaliella salina]
MRWRVMKCLVTPSSSCCDCSCKCCSNLSCPSGARIFFENQAATNLSLSTLVGRPRPELYNSMAA